MGINLTNFLTSKSKNTRMMDFQDLDHIDGLSISALSADLYKTKRDDLVMFYFRDGANHASVYTQSKIISENIKWNINQKSKKIYSLIVNTRNANAFTGKQGYENQIPNLIKKINYTQNKFLWMKAALGIMTTDTKPKLAMEQCKIGDKEVKIYGVAKGSGMIFPNMGTTLAYIFTDANLSNDILSKLLKKNITNTFNAISCDGDTSTNDMVSIFATNKANNSNIKSINDIKLKKFDKALNNVLLNLAKRVVSDGEGASKFVTININKSKSEQDAKTIAFSIANSALVKTAIAGEDPNWGRIVMAIGKAGPKINLNKLGLKFGNYQIIQDGKLYKNYDEKLVAEYMKGENIEINVDLFTGPKSFTAFTMDFTKNYIEINADYRS